MAKQYVIALDQGTTSTRAILFDDHAEQKHKHQIEFESITPPHRDGWTEHDPMVLWQTSKECLYECIKYAREHLGIEREHIRALGITNQRETTIVWDRNTGQPLYNAIVWHDPRTHSTCQQLRANHCGEKIRKISGLPISTYFSGVKLRWLMDNVPHVAAAIEDGTAIFGTVDTWLVWNLTKGAVYVTDVTNAGRTMLMNIHTLEWDQELLKILGVPRKILPDIRSSSEEYGFVADVLPESELEGLPISGIIGDQQGALVGQTCFEVGEAKNTYGTGAFLIVNTGTEPKFSTHNLLTTPAFKFGNDACVYSLEGSVAVAGSGVKWLRDSLGIIATTGEVETLASSVEDTGDVYFVPAFSGLFAPRWREDARGTIVGMTNSTSKAHFARATLESIAFQVNDVLKAVSKDIDGEIPNLRVDGGASENDLLLQIQADVIGSTVVRPRITETTALGAAFCAGHAVGLFQSLDELKSYWQADQEFGPMLWSEEKRAKKLNHWERAVQKSLGWALDEEDEDNGDIIDAEETAKGSSFLTAERLTSASVGFAIGSIAVALVCRFMRK